MIKTFRKGGIHPPDSKITAGRAIEYLPLPSSVSVPLSQHAGMPALPVVAKGDKVLTGQVIGKSAGYISSFIHSPVSGTIKGIDAVSDGTGLKKMSVRIDVSGDEWVDTINRSPELDENITLSADEIISRCLESGIAGLGGAAFPTHVKLRVPDGKKCDLLVINGVECEPYLTSDHRLMLEKGKEIITGIRIMMKAVGTEKAMIGIENNKPDAIAHMTSLCSQTKGITVHPLKVKYPQGFEKHLIKALIGREVPGGGLPIDVGCVVQNVATAFAVYEAVQKNKPLFERVVTVSGKSLSRPSNFMARVGTPVSSLIEAAGGLPDNTGKIINGGPMMGKSMNTTDAPVVKSMSGILVINEKDSVRSQTEPCIRCSKCVSACPLNLEPYLLMTLSSKGLWERASKERITDCCECGSCSYTCPAARPLLDYIRLGKNNVMQMNRLKNIPKAVKG